MSGEWAPGRKSLQSGDLSSRVKRESRKIFGRGLGSHQNFLISQVRRRGPLGIVDDNKKASDHRPVWAVITFDPSGQDVR